MTEYDATEDSVDEPAEQSEFSEGLEVLLAQELIEDPRRCGASFVGPDGLLAGVTRTVLQTALDAEMTGHLG